LFFLFSESFYSLKPNVMNLTTALGGLAGAGTLTLLNQTSKKFDKDAPRLDVLGMNAVAKLVKGSGLKNALLNRGKLMPVSMTADLLSNSLYYAMADAGNKKKTFVRGALLGLSAGIGAVTLAKPLGLDARIGEAPVRTKVMTIAWYLAGGLAAAAVINLLKSSKRDTQMPETPVGK
jgi:hypothetical protein